MDVYVDLTCYEVSCLPFGYKARRHFTLTVESRGGGLWAVCRHGMCYDAVGNRNFELSSTSRDDEFLARYRFPLERALEVAQEIAPRLKINRFTVADALANGPDWQ